MKKIKFLTMSLLALFMACFTACNNNAAVDYSEYIVGTWTAHLVNYAEALVFNADGTMQTYLVGSGDSSMVLSYYMEDHGTYTLKGNKLTMVWSDGTKYDITITISPYKLLAFDYDGNGIDFDYDYCEEDLADEIVGMWVCTQSSHEDVEEMIIQTFKGDETLILTGKLPESGEHVVNGEINYKVFGDLLMIYGPNGEVAKLFKMTYTPKATALGDIVVFNEYLPDTDVTSTSSWLRVKQYLNLTGTYDYSSAYVSNAKGKDEDITIAGHTFNMAKIKARDFDVMFDSELFCLDLNANSIKHYFRPNGRDTEIELPITVAGNKVTLDFSAQFPVCRKVEMYMYQDADDSQLHMYMPTTSFINYFANMEIFGLIAEGKINQTDSTAVAKVFADMEARVESINVSFVFKARK